MVNDRILDPMPTDPRATEAKQAERSATTLRSFVRRARRVESHSLAADRQQLLTWASGTIEGQTHPDGTTWLRRDLPPEEALESLAVRVRPFILQDDPIHHAKVTKALGWFAREADDATREAVATCKKQWKRADARNSQTLRYVIHLSNGTTGGQASATDARLALAWLYGDTVHATEKHHEETALFGIDERYAAASLIVCGLAVSVIMTMNVLQTMRASGLIHLPEDAFTEQVVADETDWHEATAFQAPVGTPLPASADDPLPPEFVRFQSSVAGQRTG